MKTLATICLFFTVCAGALAKETEFPFKEAQGAVSAPESRSWADFTVGGFKLQWEPWNERTTFFRIQHFQFCVVPAERMKFKDIKDPTQFLYRSLEQKAVINQSSREPSNRASRFPTSPSVPVKRGSTLMLWNKSGKCCLALFPENTSGSLIYKAKLWQNVAANDASSALQVEVDEATGIRTAKIAPMKEFFIPEIGRRIVFVWDPSPDFPHRNAEDKEFYKDWPLLSFDLYFRSLREAWIAILETGTELSNIKNPFPEKFKRVKGSGPVVSTGLIFPPPQKYKNVNFLKIDDVCVGIELASVSEKEVVFRWKPFTEEKTQVAQRATAKIE